jgi:hypothetical protein
MTYTEIYIDDASIDLGQGELSCPITYSLIDIKNLNNRSGSRTKTVSVPRTVKNDRIFGVAFDVNATNRFDKYVPHRVRIEEATEVIFDGLCKLTNVTLSKIDFFCYGELSAFKGISGTSTLQDLRLNDLDHTYDTTIYDTWDGIYPTYVEADYIYPVIDYGTFWTRSLSTPEEIDINVVDLFPAVFLERIIRQICLDNGYTLVTSFFNDPQMAKLCIPFTNKDFVHDTVYSLYTEGFQGYTSGYEILDGTTGTETLNISTVVFDPLFQFNTTTDEFIATFNQTSVINFTFAYIITNNTDIVPAQFIIETYNGVIWTEFERYDMAGPTFPNSIFTSEFHLTMLIGEGFRFRIEKTNAIADITVGIDITVDPSAGGKLIEEGEVVQLAPNLPPIKQIDLISWCYKMFNWVIDVDSKKGIMYIDTYNNYYNTPDVIDMSNSLNLDIEPIIGYDDTDFARKYDFKYTLDQNDYYLTLQNQISNDDNNINFGDGNLYLTSQGDTTLIGPVGFSPTVINKTFTSVMELPCMIDLRGGAINAPLTVTSHAPRIMIYGGLVDVATLTSSAYAAVITDDGSKSSIPFVYFQKRVYGSTLIDAYTQNLAFDIYGSRTLNSAQVIWSPGTLIETYYRKSIEDLSTSASVTAYFNLTAADLSSLDFGTRWYVDFFEAQFKLNRILDYQPGRMSPTKVELVKVGAYVNPRSLDTLE